MSAVDDFLAEMDLLALADAVGVLVVSRGVCQDKEEVAPWR